LKKRREALNLEKRSETIVEKGGKNVDFRKKR
jgi:hypothetical protein